MHKLNLLSIIFLIVLNYSCTKKVIEISSPTSLLKAEISVNDAGLKLELFDINNSVINVNLGNFVFDSDVLGNGYEIKNTRKTSVNYSWSTVYGEKNKVQDNHNEVTITLTDRDA